jgi:hypothetical protein
VTCSSSHRAHQPVGPGGEAGQRPDQHGRGLGVGPGDQAAADPVGAVGLVAGELQRLAAGAPVDLGLLVGGAAAQRQPGAGGLLDQAHLVLVDGPVLRDQPGQELVVRRPLGQGTTARAARPCRQALTAERLLPAGDVGPVACCFAFLRFASICASPAMRGLLIEGPTSVSSGTGSGRRAGPPWITYI